MQDDGGALVVVIARVERLGDDALCAFMLDHRGRVQAAVNARLEGQAVAHIRQHAENGGIEGVQLCAADCRVTEHGRGEVAAF